MSSQFPQEDSDNDTVADSRIETGEGLQGGQSCGQAPFQVSILHLDSPEAGVRMKRAMRLILKRVSRPEEDA